MYLTTLDPFARVTRATVMPLDGVRRDGDVLLRFDVPGSDPESIEVTVDRGVLSVSVKRQEERAENDKFFVRERTMGTFTRRLHLSKNLNSDAVEAATPTACSRSGSRSWSRRSRARWRSARARPRRSSRPDPSQEHGKKTSGRRATTAPRRPLTIWPGH